MWGGVIFNIVTSLLHTSLKKSAGNVSLPIFAFIAISHKDMMLIKGGYSFFSSIFLMFADNLCGSNIDHSNTLLLIELLQSVLNMIRVIHIRGIRYLE